MKSAATVFVMGNDKGRPVNSPENAERRTQIWCGSSPIKRDALSGDVCSGRAQDEAVTAGFLGLIKRLVGTAHQPREVIAG